MKNLVVLVALAGCATQRAPVSSANVSSDIDVPMLLLEVGAERIPSLRKPEEPVDALEDAVRAGRGPERMDALRKLARARLWAAEEAGDEAEAKRIRKAAARTVRDARGRTKNQAVLAELRFVDLWNAWRAEKNGAEEVAAHYVETQQEAGELEVFAWLLRGEMALAREDFPQAAEAFRWLVVQIDHPLYAYALWRTAACYRGMGREDDAKQALKEATEIGERRGAHAAAQKVAAVARAELGPDAPPPPPPEPEPGEEP